MRSELVLDTVVGVRGCIRSTHYSVASIHKTSQDVLSLDLCIQHSTTCIRYAEVTTPFLRRNYLSSGIGATAATPLACDARVAAPPDLKSRQAQAQPHCFFPLDLSTSTLPFSQRLADFWLIEWLALQHTNGLLTC